MSLPLLKENEDTDCPFTITEEMAEALTPRTSTVCTDWPDMPLKVLSTSVRSEPEETEKLACWKRN